MTQSNDIEHLGISFENTELRLAEVRITNGKILVTKIGTVQTNLEFNFETIKDLDKAEQIGKFLAQYIEEEAITAKKIAFSIPDSMALVRKIPIDTTMDDEEKRTHIKWEIEQYIVSTVSGFSYDSHILESGSEALVVVVRKDVVNFLKKIVGRVGLRLFLIDLDIFSAEAIFEKNYAPLSNDYFALVNIDSDCINILFFTNAHFFSTSSVTNQIDKIIDESANEKIANSVYTKLEEIFERNNLGDVDLKYLYIYGGYANDYLVKIMEKRFETQCELVDPFRELEVTATVGADENYNKFSLKFLESLGVAIRQN